MSTTNKAKRVPTQREQIIKYMREYGSITRLDAANRLLIFELASRIGELQDRGWLFEKKWESRKNLYGQTKSYVRYSIKKEGSSF